MTTEGEPVQAPADYTERMAAEHRGDTPEATAAAERELNLALKTETPRYGARSVDTKKNAGEALQGFLAQPKDTRGKLPALLVIHEWWGLNDNIRAMTRQLAARGYVALAVDLYGGEVAKNPEQAKQLMQAATAQPETLKSNLRQAIRYLKSRSDTSEALGVIGWCFGGGWSLKTALIAPDAIDATVVYYGHVPTDSKTLDALQSPVLAFFGAQDQSITLQTVNAFRATLQNLDKRAHVHLYPEAGHAFANPSGKNYVPQAAEDAWQRTLAFLDQHLQSADTQP